MSDIVERLRGDGLLDHLRSIAEEAADEIKRLDDHVTAQRRQIDKLINEVAKLHAALPDLKHVIGWLDGGCDPTKAAQELRIYQARINAVLEGK